MSKPVVREEKLPRGCPPEVRKAIKRERWNQTEGLRFVRGLQEERGPRIAPSTDELAQAVAGKVATLLPKPDAIAAVPPAKGDDAERNMQQVAAAVGGVSSAKIIVIAQDESLTVDDRMSKIWDIDGLAYIWTSPHWQKLFRDEVSAQAIRKTPTWKLMRKKLKKPD